ncbi:MAG: translation elongation factor-like protein [Nanoarchaeota archaeon]|nr:translation elongation factor-like protein [Nanoarchaeota archaeon]
MEKRGKKVGKITHYFDKIGVAIVELNTVLKVGDRIGIGDLEQDVSSMQIDNKAIKKAGKGQSIGLKVDALVRKNQGVFKL